ncbi:MAG: BadF/BadG/BcrA/BcrD ATPase family protein [Betaproteobacteria bacterium]
MSSDAAVALGLDAGGTQTRWATVDADGRLLQTGTVAAISALQMGEAAGRATVALALADLAQQLGADQVGRVCAGVTGVGGQSEAAALALRLALAQALHLDAALVTVRSDIEVAYRAAFAPGQGYLVYAGTGSVAAYVDASGELQRAGGRGGILDDAGGGYWIAREALRQIWREEDLRPGAWRDSVMAQRVFEHIGASDWASSRQFVYVGTRGAMGQLALAVAAAAEADPAAMSILQRAGTELARLGLVLCSRFGPRPVALGGRAAHLHPAIVQSMRAALPPQQTLELVTIRAELAAARMAGEQLRCLGPTSALNAIP